jgi:hypothetical protein
MGKGKKKKMGVMPVHEEVAALLASWNPPPVDNAIEILVGVPPEPGDVAATAHVRDPLLDHDRNPALDSVDAASMYADDGDDADESDVEDYTGDEWDHAALKAEIDDRNEDRDSDDALSKGGSSDDLRERLIEDDVNQRIEADADEG